MSHHLNLIRIQDVANALDNYKNEIAFIGGATVSLYTDQPDETETRPTDDIDILIEIATYSAYTRLQSELATCGFEIDRDAKVTCRYRYQGLVVDIMPMDEEVLGFSNRWYKEGFDNRIAYEVQNGTDIQIFPVPYFIASKLEAFKGRGGHDGRMSKDFEDIIFVFDNRSSIWDDLLEQTGTISDYIRSEFKALLQEKHLHEWIEAHLEPTTSAARSSMITEGMNKVAKG